MMGSDSLIGGCFIVEGSFTVMWKVLITVVRESLKSGNEAWICFEK